MKRFQKLAVLVIAVSISGLLPLGAALADDITNNVTVGFGVHGDTIANGGSTTVTYQLSQTNNSPVNDLNGCDVNNNNPATATISVAGATAIPSSFPFTSCGNSSGATVVFSSVNAGDHPVTIVVTGGKAGSLYNTGSANWTLHVQAAPTDTTKPVITGTRLPLANINGWNNTDVAVSFTCADELGGSGVNVNTVAGDNATVTTEGADQSVSSDGVCTDVAGNVAVTPVTVNNINIDKTNPVVLITGSPANPGNDNSPVFTYVATDLNLQAVTCTMDAAPVACTSTTATVGPLTDGSHTFVVTATDLAGNTGSDSYAWLVDTTKPVITGFRLPLANVNGWNNTDVTVSFVCADEVGGSGVALDTVAGGVVTTEGASQSLSNSGICTDNAGNVADLATVNGINIDKTAPVVTLTTPAANDQFLQFSVVNANWSVSETLSGLDGAPVATAPNGSPINTAITGAYVFSVSATDLAGNTTSVSHNYSVYTYVFGGLKAPVSLSMKEFKQGSTIPVKFQIFNSVTGLPVQGPAATLKVNGNNAIASGGSNFLNHFRYDTSAQQYIYNLSTKSLSAGNNVLNVLFVSAPPANPVATTIVIK